MAVKDGGAMPEYDYMNSKCRCYTMVIILTMYTVHVHNFVVDDPELDIAMSQAEFSFYTLFNLMIITITTRSTYMPMSRWGWMIAAHINYCWTHNTCSSIAKTHADALSNYWISRQTEQQGSCLCNCIAHRK